MRFSWIILLSKKAIPLLSTAVGASELNKAVDAERKRYKQTMNKEPVDPVDPNLSVKRVGFGQIDQEKGVK